MDVSGDLVSIPVNDFMSGSKVPVDLYIKLSGEKYILIARAGTVNELERLRKFKDKDISNFYVQPEDYNSYVNHSLQISELLLSKPQLNDQQKASILGRSTSAVFEEFKKLGVNEESFQHAKQIAASMLHFINSKPDYTNLISSLGNISDDLVKHSLAVSMLAPIIGQALGWKKADTIEKLAVGGLLHDIGKKEISEEILLKPRATMTQEEVELYESHPYRGMQLLQSVPSISDDIIAIVYEHHENAIGQGFPRKLRDLKMNPLARIVALANVFCELTLATETNTSPRSSQDAIIFMEFTMGRPFNKQAFAALKETIQNGGL